MTDWMLIVAPLSIGLVLIAVLVITRLVQGFARKLLHPSPETSAEDPGPEPAADEILPTGRPKPVAFRHVVIVPDDEL